jgi:hypothetical protein
MNIQVMWLIRRSKSIALPSLWRSQTDLAKIRKPKDHLTIQVLPGRDIRDSCLK